MKIVILYLLSMTIALHAETPEIYKSVPEMIEDLGDYSESNGTFKVISKTPFHIQLSPLCVSGHDAEIIDEYAKSALIYGIYKTFIHTDVNEITITSTPVTSENKYLTEFSRKISISKTEALKALEKFKKFKAFNELLNIQDLGGFKLVTWSKGFNPYLYNDQGFPGLNEFHKELALISKN